MMVQFHFRIFCLEIRHEFGSSYLANQRIIVIAQHLDKIDNSAESIQNNIIIHNNHDVAQVNSYIIPC